MEHTIPSVSSVGRRWARGFGSSFRARSDLPAIYSAASVFAFPSLYEGFGMPILEAMSRDARRLLERDIASRGGRERAVR